MMWVVYLNKVQAAHVLVVPADDLVAWDPADAGSQLPNSFKWLEVPSPGKKTHAALRSAGPAVVPGVAAGAETMREKLVNARTALGNHKSCKANENFFRGGDFAYPATPQIAAILTGGTANHLAVVRLRTPQRALPAQIARQLGWAPRARSHSRLR